MANDALFRSTYADSLVNCPARVVGDRAPGSNASVRLPMQPNTPARGVVLTGANSAVSALRRRTNLDPDRITRFSCGVIRPLLLENQLWQAVP